MIYVFLTKTCLDFRFPRGPCICHASQTKYFFKIFYHMREMQCSGGVEDDDGRT
jgi:hypothetical protein